MTTVRFEKREQASEAETIHWLWVVGPLGAVSTWFSPATREIIGYSVCDGITVHSATDRGDEVLDSAPCEFLESPCWFWRLGRSVHLFGRNDPLVLAYDDGDLDAVWVSLEAVYGQELAA